MNHKRYLGISIILFLVSYFIDVLSLTFSRINFLVYLFKVPFPILFFIYAPRILYLIPTIYLFFVVRHRKVYDKMLGKTYDNVRGLANDKGSIKINPKKNLSKKEMIELASKNFTFFSILFLILSIIGIIISIILFILSNFVTLN